MKISKLLLVALLVFLQRGCLADPDADYSNANLMPGSDDYREGLPSELPEMGMSDSDNDDFGDSPEANETGFLDPVNADSDAMVDSDMGLITPGQSDDSLAHFGKSEVESEEENEIDLDDPGYYADNDEAEIDLDDSGYNADDESASELMSDSE